MKSHLVLSPVVDALARLVSSSARLLVCSA